MNVDARIENPDDISVTLTITLPLGHWKKLREDMDKNPTNSWVAFDIARQIRQIVGRLERTVTADPRVE